MSICKLRALPGVTVIICLLAALLVPAAITGDSPALADSTDKPDLVIESVSWYPEIPVIGDTVTFTVTIKNQGDGYAGSSLIAYYIDDVYLETDYARQAAANTTFTNIYSWEAEAGEHSFRAVIDCSDSIDEENEDNNEKTYAFYAVAADLAVDEIVWTPENPSIGDKVTFTVTVTNRGNYMAPAFYVNLYIDEKPRIKRLVMPIYPGNSSNVTYTWAALSGPHTVEAHADVLNQVDEINETNNYKAVNYATATPDLVIDTITWSPTNRTENGDVTFSTTVKNQGNGTSGSSILAFFIDGVCQDSTYIGQLSPGSSTTETFTQALDANAHTFKAIADAGETLTEIDETNNSSEVSLPAVAADLIVQSITWSPTTPLTGHSFTFTVTVKNQGVKRANSIDLNLHIDDDSTISNRLPGLDPGASTSATFPWSTQQSKITVTAVVDEDNILAESNEDNNTKTVNVSLSKPTPTADLTIQSISYTPADPATGDIVSIIATVENEGSGDASSSYLAYYVDGNLLNTIALNAIEAGGTVTRKMNWQATGGTHIVEVAADYHDSVWETSESNNKITATISIPAPDLTIQSIRWTPLVPSPGDDVTFTIVIENDGDLEASDAFLNYYVDDIYRGNHSIEYVEPGNTITRTFTWEVESDSHIFKVVIDKADETAEIDETNNERTVYLPAPDLAIQGVSWSPAELSEGTTVTFMITVRNLGSGPAVSPYLSCYIDNELLNSLPIDSIEGGSTAVGIFNWTADAGEHVLEVIADSDDLITENDETNNDKTINLANPLPPPVEPEPATEPEVEVAEEPEPEPVEPVSDPATSEATVDELLGIENEIQEEETTDNLTDEEDIAGNIGEEDSSGIMGVLMNKVLIFAVAGVGVGAIAILLLLRRRAKKTEE